MEWVISLAKALDHVLAQDEDFCTCEIVDASKYALHKYGHEYPALGEAIVQIIHQERFSLWTMLNCKEKRSAHA